MTIPYSGLGDLSEAQVLSINKLMARGYRLDTIYSDKHASLSKEYGGLDVHVFVNFPDGRVQPPRMDRTMAAHADLADLLPRRDYVAVVSWTQPEPGIAVYGPYTEAEALAVISERQLASHFQDAALPDKKYCVLKLDLA